VGIFTILCLRSVRARGGRLSGFDKRMTLAGCAVLLSFGLLATVADQVPDPIAQTERIGRDAPTLLFDRSVASAFVEEHTRPGETVVIMSSLGKRIAAGAGVTDVFPLNHGASVLFREQLDFVLDRARDAGVRTLFLGAFAPQPGSEWAVPIAADLRASGFERFASTPNGFGAWRFPPPSRRGR
jgi:hypothetical protein